jgi:C4-dicarboxylate-specific signal transduction histidine kinase
MKINLPFKIGSTSFILAFVGILVVSLFAYYNAVALVKKYSMAHLTHELSEITLNIGRSYKNLEEDVAFLRHSGPVNGMVKDSAAGKATTKVSPEFWQARFAGLCTMVLKQKPSYRSISVVSNSGKELVRVMKQKEKIAKINEAALRQLSGEPVFENALKLASGQNFISENFIQNRKVKNHVIQTPFFSMSTPVVAKSGHVQGVLIIEVDCAEFFFSTTILDPNFAVFIGDDSGEIIAVNEMSPETQDAGIKESVSEDYALFTRQFLDQNKKRSFPLEIEEQGRKVGVAADKYFFDRQNSDRFIIVGVQAPNLPWMSDSSLLRREIIMLVAIVAMFLGFIIFFLTRLLVRPILDLAEAVDRISRGEDVVIPAVNRSDETGILARSFAELVHQMNDANQNLRQEIVLNKEMEKERQNMQVKALSHAKLASLGEMATGIAHEINQPLSFLKIVYEAGLRDIAAKRVNMVEMADDFNEALYQIGRISTIIDHLRIYGHKDSQTQARVNLAEIIDRVLILMGERLRINNIKLIRQIEKELPDIYASPTRIEQIFINLILNSIYALQEREGKEISISISSTAEKIVMRFTDNGSGIPPSVAKRIFEPFFTTKEVGKGTGLGLAVVYGIIDEHGGTIDYDTEFTGGASFIITFPLVANTHSSSGC